MTTARPRYPGARWWKFDFHTHTPASTDTPHWQSAVGTTEEVTPEKWLLKYMTAGIDCVAVTDHNSGLWIDRLKAALATMKAAADRGAGLPGFRDLTLFPGVEISVQGGVHVLAVLPPHATTGDVDTLLGSVGYKGTKGDSNGVTTRGLAEVLGVIRGAGGLPIPAHADRAKGLLECVEGSRRSRVDANTLRQAMEVEGLLAVEWCGGDTEVPDCAVSQASRLARVLGSDTHSFQQKNALGSAFTWVKMASPTLEGLRLALLDGNGVSIRRSDEGPFDPERLPAHTIQAIEIDKARFMGNRKAERLVLSPFFNAVVGGRGTGKSTVVHALRLACGRGAELLDGSEPRTQFDAFRKVPKGRTGEGGLREETVLAVEWQHDDARFRISWRGSASQAVVEERRGDGWEPTQSQAVNASRFPLRIFSQGQVATIAGAGRRALVSIIDESAGVEPLRVSTDEATRVFLEQRARLRTLDGRLAELPEVERKLGEAARKLEAFSQADHAAVLREYARTQGQVREVKSAFEQARAVAERIGGVAEEVALDDWSGPSLTEADADLLAWRTAVDQRLEELRERLLAEATALRAEVDGWNHHERFKAWRAQQQAAKQAHDTLQAQLASQGVPGTGVFERLTREHQALEQKRRELVRLEGDREALVRDIEGQRAVMATRRAAITDARQEFVARVLHNNEHVRITVVPHGFDPRQIEREVRGLLDATDDRFATDILGDESDEERGLARDLAVADDKVAALHAFRARVVTVDPSFGGHFRNHLTKKHKLPEFADHLLAWSPDDDLRIEYQREGRWVPIDQGSQGQRSAALLAFLLAFGEEPIVLDQPEDDLDNHLIYDLIVQQIRENKLRRQLVIVTHNPNIVVNGDAELVHVMDFIKGQCVVRDEQSGALQEAKVRQEVCRVMEGGSEAFARRWKRLGGEG